jgi:Beta-galactosidase
MTARRASLLGAAAIGLLAGPLVSEVRIRRVAQPSSDRWRTLEIEPPGPAMLGFSARPRQAEAFGLDPLDTLRTLLDLPFGIVRLGAYWNRMEPAAGAFDTTELDLQVELVERAGRKIVICVGAVKTFGYPECFIPGHRLGRPIPEGRLVTRRTHATLLEAATAHVRRVVERYRDHPSVVAWQVEHEAVDPLGVEHSWRLGTDFVEDEVAVVRASDPARPILLNGFLPTSLAVRAQQAWRTRDQGDSLAFAGRAADIVGLDVYPRHAVVGAGSWSVYLEGSPGAWNLPLARQPSQQVIVTEGQAEPWEASTRPPGLQGRAPYSCGPDRVIDNYDRCLRAARGRGVELSAYLFWGAEYWVRRLRDGDPSYMGAVARVLEHG